MEIERVWQANMQVYGADKVWQPGLSLRSGVSVRQHSLHSAAGHPDRIVHGQADEPAKQQVVLGLLHQLALRAHAVEQLNEHGAQQLLGGNAGASAFDVGRSW